MQESTRFRSHSLRAGNTTCDWSQAVAYAADALLLSKPDLAHQAERQAFEDIAAAQYPAKSYLGT